MHIDPLGGLVGFLATGLGIPLTVSVSTESTVTGKQGDAVEGRLVALTEVLTCEVSKLDLPAFRLPEFGKQSRVPGHTSRGSQLRFPARESGYIGALIAIRA
jgi:hypothetical protein